MINPWTRGTRKELPARRRFNEEEEPVFLFKLTHLRFTHLSNPNTPLEINEKVIVVHDY